jgi:uncharacterized protein YcbX
VTPVGARTRTGTVVGLWSYPVKSFQGRPVTELAVGPDGVVGDRRWALVSPDGTTVLSAKRHKRLLEAHVELVPPGGELRIHLPDGRALTPSEDADGVLSDWIGVPCRLAEAGPDTRVSYEMTFDPPDDEAELVAIPAPPGAFVDLAHLHVLSTATLDGGAAEAPDLEWDVRRFRPNVVLDLPHGTPFEEDSWAGGVVGLGEVRIRVDQPTVRCAMPLRAQPSLGARSALPARPELYPTLEALHGNHLGVYASVVEPGTIRIGDSVEVLGR